MTTKDQVLEAIPYLPQVTMARWLAETLPHLSRSSIDRALRELSSSDVMVMHGSGGKCYGRIREGSLL